MRKTIMKVVMLLAAFGMIYAGYRLYSINRVYQAEDDAQKTAVEMYKPQIDAVEDLARDFDEQDGVTEQTAQYPSYDTEERAEQSPEQPESRPEGQTETEPAKQPAGGAGRPSAEPPAGTGSAASPRQNDPLASVKRLKADYPDAAGWLTVPGTRIDYPVVQSKDNEYYLRRGMDGKYLYAGTPFLDSNCQKDLSCSNTIIYGHNLNNGKMFSDLTRYKNRGFAEQHEKLYFCTDTEIITAHVITCVTVDPAKCPWLYDPEPYSDYPVLLKAAAPYLLKDPTALPSGARLLTLSTCDYSFDGARTLLIAYFFNKQS